MNHTPKVPASLHGTQTKLWLTSTDVCAVRAYASGRQILCSESESCEWIRSYVQTVHSAESAEWLSRDSTKRLWFGCPVHVLSKRSGHFQYLIPNPQDLLHIHRLLPLHMSGWRNPRCKRPMIWTSRLVCRCIENYAGVSWYAASAVPPKLLDNLGKCPCCHVLLRQDYQKDNYSREIQNCVSSHTFPEKHTKCIDFNCPPISSSDFS